MKKRCIFLVSLMLTLLAITPVQARIVCWTNKDGIKECGDRLPPEYAQEGHKEISPQGTVIDETEAAKTDEELVELKRLAIEKAEKRRQEEEQARRDKMLLDTFSKVEDIEIARDSKIAAIETSINLAERRITKLQADKDNLVKKAAARERAGNEPSKELVNDIASIDKHIEANNKFIADKRKEQKEVRDQYKKDIERFKEIRLLRR